MSQELGPQEPKPQEPRSSRASAWVKSGRGLPDACRRWYRVQRQRLMATFVRLILWGAAVWVALWPAMELSHAKYSLDIENLMEIYKSGHFQEFFFISVVVAIIGLSNIFDNVATARRTGNLVGDLSFILFTMLGVVYLGTLFYALPHFVEISLFHSDLNAQVVNRDHDIIRNALLAGVFTEIVIALRERPDRPVVSTPATST
jgi:hypothetical protein